MSLGVYRFQEHLVIEKGDNQWGLVSDFDGNLVLVGWAQPKNATRNTYDSYIWFDEGSKQIPLR